MTSFASTPPASQPRHLWRPGEEALWTARWARIDEQHAEIVRLSKAHTDACAAIRDFPKPSEFAYLHGTEVQEYREWSREIDRLALVANGIGTQLRHAVLVMDGLIDHAYDRITGAA